VCVNKGASIHDVLLSGVDLCINILSKDQKDISNLCSSKDSESLRYANDCWNTDETPFLKDAQSNIFSQVDEVISYNSHSIVIAKVLRAQSADSFNGLIYADGGYLA